MTTERCEVLKENPFRLEVEGTDGTGKTVLINSLNKIMTSEYPSKKIVCLPEFSDTALGRMIEGVIKEKTFFSLGVKNPNITLAETLCLAGDYIARLEDLERSSNREPDIILSDRGVATFLVYQKMRLDKKYPGFEDSSRKWIDHLFSPIKPPNLTIVLTSPEKSIRRRLINRGDRVTTESMRFILAAQSKYIELALNNDNFLILENSDGKLQEVVEKVAGIIVSKVH